MLYFEQMVVNTEINRPLKKLEITVFYFYILTDEPRIKKKLLELKR